MTLVVKDPHTALQVKVLLSWNFSAIFKHILTPPGVSKNMAKNFNWNNGTHQYHPKRGINQYHKTILEHNMKFLDFVDYADRFNQWIGSSYPASSEPGESLLVISR